MSSTYFTSSDMTMIDRLLAEVSPPSADRNVAIVTIQARLLVTAFEADMRGEEDLRQLLSDHIKLSEILAVSRTHWENEAHASPHREEHMLPSPEEEFNCAASINSMVTAPRDERVLIARNAIGESAMVRMVPMDDSAHAMCRWVRADTDEPFDAVHWVATTWTADEVQSHLREG